VAAPTKKRPWLKFYPQDWRGDPKLRMCSIGARGLWAEMICLMHEADPYGHLLINAVPVTNRQLASLAGIPQADCMKFMLELESSGVYSRAGDNTIYSRRMVRDAEKSLQGKNDAEKRWGNGEGDVPPTPKPSGVPNGSPTPDPNSLEARSYKSNGTGTRASLISPEAFEITGALEQACGFMLPEETPVGWAGCAMWVQKCLNEGWVGEVMIDAAGATARKKRNGFIESYRYLEKPLAEAMAVFRTPVSKVEIRQGETVSVTANRQGSSGSSAHDAIARLRARVESPRDSDNPADPNVVRLLSQG
jgi:hypothetical protein